MSTPCVVSLLISLLVALILVPVILARFPPPRRQAAWLPVPGQWHRRNLIRVLRHPWRLILGSAVLFGFGLLLLTRLGFETSTSLDRGEFTLILQTPARHGGERH